MGRRGIGPPLIGFNIKISESELALLNAWRKSDVAAFRTQSSAARYLLVKALRQEVKTMEIGKERA